ncbi:MAG: hypothetical protein KDA42_02830 [Planctomycetales bacterium]|nr:hypothetical protein [Planctomycetales bacterium]
MSSAREYAAELVDRFGRGWNRFFFIPVDPLPTAVLRIAVGAIALYWQVTYTADLDRFLGADGLFPQALVERLSGGGFSRWTLFALFPDATGIWIAHGLAFVVLLAFLLGLKARVTAPLALYVVLSYIHRAPMVTGLHEHLLTFLLAYLCIAPCGAALSIDAYLVRRRSAETAGEQNGRSVAANIALRLIQIHLVVVYGMMGLAKLGIGSETWWLGEAVWWMAARPETRLVDLTPWLHAHTMLVNAWSHGIVLFELSFAILIWNRMARPLLLALSVPMYFGLALISGQALFCLLLVTAGIAFLPAAKLRDWLKSIDGAPANTQQPA